MMRWDARLHDVRKRALVILYAPGCWLLEFALHPRNLRESLGVNTLCSMPSVQYRDKFDFSCMSCASRTRSAGVAFTESSLLDPVRLDLNFDISESVSCR